MSYQPENTNPPFWLSLIPILAVAFLLGLSVFVYDTGPHIPLFLGCIVAVVAARIGGYKWETIKLGFTKSISRSIQALLILFIIGMITGVWIGSGIVPAMIYYGVDLLIPAWFLPLTLLFCSIMSLVTGSSWTTIGTAGVAALGIGQILGISPPMIAGAIVSGAFFGDKLSPLSDSTNLTPSIVGVELYEHIHHMLKTTIPNYLLSIVAYMLLGFSFDQQTASSSKIEEYQQVLRNHFQFSIFLVIPVIAVIAMITFRVPALISLSITLLLSGFLQIFIQGQGLGEVFQTLYGGYSIDTQMDAVDQLLSRGGLTSMYSTVALGMISLGFGGILHQCGMLQSLVQGLKNLMNRAGNLILGTLITCFLVNIIGANQYLAVILPGQMFEDWYKRLDLPPKNLSRALESGGTLTAPLIPWNSSGVFIVSVLSVNPLAYAPYAFFCLLGPLFTALYGYIQFKFDES